MIPKVFGSLAVLVACIAIASADDIKGKVKSTDTDKNTITVTVDDKDQTFNVKDAKIYTTGKKKKNTPAPEIALTLGAVKTDSQVTVTTEKKDGKDVVTAVKVEGGKKKKKKTV